tara:strand:- start:14 stop:400 length:387 start_codon:yes stop_codon:yes gene_type:complete
MKKILLILVILISYSSSSNACTAFINDVNQVHSCSIKELKTLLKLYKKNKVEIQKKSKSKFNMFDDLIPYDEREKRIIPYKEAVKLIKSTIKEKEKYIMDTCNFESSVAKNDWSAKKIYRSCLKKWGI